METLLRDVRFGLRSLVREKGFAATVALTLLVCVAANTAIFAIVNSVLLRPLPVPQAERILMLSNRYPKAGVGDLNQSSVADYYERRREMPAFEEQALFDTVGRTMEIGGTAERVTGMMATPSLFPLLRVTPAMGRAFTEEEGEQGAEHKVILSHGLWQQLYGGESGVLGRELRLNGVPHTVVGVMPAGFNFVDPEVRYWIPAAFTAEEKSAYHSNNWYHIGRLKPGASLELAQQQVDALNRANLERMPQWKELLTNAGFHTKVEPLQDLLVREIRGALYLLWGGAAFVLLLGGLNIANVVLARLTLRRKELATRLALGAGRGQLVRQLVVENVLLALIGGAAGVAAGAGLLQGLASFGLDQFPRAGEVRIDATVVVIELALAGVVGVLIGLAPLGETLRVQLTGVLREDSRTGTGGRGTRLVRQSLVAAQIAIAFVLLVGAGLLLASFRELLAVNPGFRSEGILTVSSSLPRANYAQSSEVRAGIKRLLDAIHSIPGVESAGGTGSIPFGGSYSDNVIIPEGYQPKAGESLISPRQVVVTPDYFETMGIGLLQGRSFDDRDTEQSTQVVIVDERLAERFWPLGNPLDRRVYMPTGPDDVLKPDPNRRWLRVVGVVQSVRLEDLAGQGNSRIGAYYLPHAQNPWRSMTFAIKTTRSPESMVRAVRAAVAQVDPELAMFDVRTMKERTELSLAPRRTAMLLALGFGGLALFISAIGTYGVLAYLISQRRREIGIRMALGSTRSGIVKLVFREGAALLGVGVVLGGAGAFALRQAVASQLYGVQPLEPAVLAGVVLLLVAVTLAACLVPARRAVQVDPVVVLSEQ
jgi:putative ABC transport system permease protein